MTDPFITAIIDYHKLVNNESTYVDLFFQIDEKNTVTAHQFIVKARLPQLMEEGEPVKKIKRKKKESKVDVILNKSEQITSEALTRVLVYAYSGQVDYTTFSPAKAIEVMRASICWKIHRLTQMVQRYLQNNLTMENIFNLLKYSDSMNVPDAKAICIEFALKNGDFFTSNNAENLGFKLYQEVTSLLLKSKNEDKKPTKIEVTEEDTILRDFKKLFEESATSGDIAFHVQGQEIKGHKSLFMDQSTELFNVIKQYEDQLDYKKPVPLIFDQEKYSRISSGAFESFKKWVYYSEENFELLYACQLLPFAKDMKIQKLYLLLEKVIGTKAATVPTVLSVLDVAYNPLLNENPALQKTLKETGLSFVVANVDKIDFDQLNHMPAVLSCHILQQLQKKLGSKWSSIVKPGSYVDNPATSYSEASQAPKSPHKPSGLQPVPEKDADSRKRSPSSGEQSETSSTSTRPNIRSARSEGKIGTKIKSPKKDQNSQNQPTEVPDKKKKK